MNQMKNKKKNKRARPQSQSHFTMICHISSVECVWQLGRGRKKKKRQALKPKPELKTTAAAADREIVQAEEILN